MINVSKWYILMVEFDEQDNVIPEISKKFAILIDCCFDRSFEIMFSVLF